MCPPRPSCLRLALTTMAIAFQRRMLLMRVSMRQSPGYGGSSLTGIELTYGVVVGPGTVMPAPRSRSVRLSRKNAACAGLWFFRIDSTTNSRLLNHLRVSSPAGLWASRWDAVHAAAALNIAVSPVFAGSFGFNFDLSVTLASIPGHEIVAKEDAGAVPQVVGQLSLRRGASSQAACWYGRPFEASASLAPPSQDRRITGPLFAAL